LSAAPYPHAVVAAAHPAASAAGAQILQRHHGNAVDAAVATAFALSVVRPASCGIGGGGFMVIHFDRDPRFGTRSIALNYREAAPAAVNAPDYFLRLERERGLKEAATRGATSVGVPGTVAGLLHALDRYGTLDRKTVLAPAIRLAEDGFVVDEEYMRVVAQQMEPYRADPARRQRFRFVWERFLRRGEVKAGDRITLPEQAEALRLIAERGADAFYSGPIAQAILDAIRADGAANHVTADDLRSGGGGRNLVESVEPLRFTARGRTFITMPPPSSGGVALAEAYGILDRVAVYPPQLKEGAGRVHLEVEAMKHAFADRAQYLADPNFADVPVKRLMSDSYLKNLASRVDPYRTLPSDRYGSTGKGAPRDDAGTCHLSVVDAHGNAVACTETIFTGFGSHVAVEKYGFCLNNTLGAFTGDGGELNVMNLVQADGNLPGPGKRPLASMTPTIVLDGKGRVQLVGGASGGPRIISAAFQAIDAVVSDNLSAADAVAKPRFHHQWQPDELLLEKPLMSDAALVESLGQRGHKVKPVASIAKVHLIRRHPSGRGWDAACDPRDGISAPAGF
jgi:gamma-glutamyltranspeptidase/glutathione hydrolase